MTDKEIKSIIDLTVQRTVKELKRKRMLKETDNIVYSDASEILTNYYRSGKVEATITYAIQGLRFDPYFRILPMYFEEGKTIEQIAEILDVDARTIARNKKRLLLSIYNEIV